MIEELTIKTIGHQGDGIAETPKGTVYVPFSLPGEVVSVDLSKRPARISEFTQTSEARIEPVCSHFGTCGGCQLQHMDHSSYLAWKMELVRSALKSEQIEHPLEPILHFTGPQRRRAVLKALKTHDGVQLGFSEKGSHNLVDLSECPVLTPNITGELDSIKQLLVPLLPIKGMAEVTVLDCVNGLDIHVEFKKKIARAQMEAAVKKVLQGSIARLTLNGETLIEQQRPVLEMGIAKVAVPPGSFVQAVKQAENAMVELVAGHLKGCKQVADLFCGSGTFSVPLAKQSIVFACENNQPALKALDSAWRGTGGQLKEVKTEKRDLFRSPILTQDLKKFQGVSFDPPRAGAQAQVKQLAQSKVKKIAAVSCNPNSLAKDLGVLINGGYRIKSITPIDQFIYTPHVEVVALLERK